MKVNMQMATDFDDKIDKIREKHYKGATKATTGLRSYVIRLLIAMEYLMRTS